MESRNLYSISLSLLVLRPPSYPSEILCDPVYAPRPQLILYLLVLILIRALNLHSQPGGNLSLILKLIPYT